jgi:hypothetical protein
MALFLLIFGAVLLMGAALTESGWTVVGFIGITFVVLGLIIHWATAGTDALR